MKTIEFLLKILAWLAIVISLLLVGVIIAGILYLSIPGRLGAGLAIGVIVLDLVFGIVYATRIWNREGTLNFIGRIRATPGLDNYDQNNSKSGNAKWRG